MFQDGLLDYVVIYSRGMTCYLFINSKNHILSMV